MYRIYSGNLLREKTFANWWKIEISQRKVLCGLLTHAARNREIRKTFLPLKIPVKRHSTVSVSHVNHAIVILLIFTHLDEVNVFTRA